MSDPPEDDVDEAPEDDEASPDESGETRRGRLRGILPDLLKRVLREGADALNDERFKETLIAEVLRKAASKGGEVYDSTEDSVRRLVSDLPLPQEVIERILERIDEYRGELFRVIADELKEWLDKVDLGYEIQKILTTLSFEITTEIRFIPNEKGVLAKPDVKAGVRVKRARKNDE